VDCCRRSSSASFAVALVDLLEFGVDNAGLVLRARTGACTRLRGTNGDTFLGGEDFDGLRLELVVR
jgi:hypothetical protein